MVNRRRTETIARAHRSPAPRVQYIEFSPSENRSQTSTQRCIGTSSRAHAFGVPHGGAVLPRSHSSSSAQSSRELAPLAIPRFAQAPMSCRRPKHCPLACASSHDGTISPEGISYSWHPSPELRTPHSHHRPRLLWLTGTHAGLHRSYRVPAVVGHPNLSPI